MKKLIFVMLVTALLCSNHVWAGAGGKGAEAAGGSSEKMTDGKTAGNKTAGDGTEGGSSGSVKEDNGRFVDRDGDGIRDGQEHRFRKRRHSQQDSEGTDESGTGNGGRKKTTQGQSHGGGQTRQVR